MTMIMRYDFDIFENGVKIAEGFMTHASSLREAMQHADKFRQKRRRYKNSLFVFTENKKCLNCDICMAQE